MRIAVVDENPARAAVIEEGLAASVLTDVTLFTERYGLVAQIERLMDLLRFCAGHLSHYATLASNASGGCISPLVFEAKVAQ